MQFLMATVCVEWGVDDDKIFQVGDENIWEQAKSKPKTILRVLYNSMTSISSSNKQKIAINGTITFTLDE